MFQVKYLTVYIVYLAYGFPCRTDNMKAFSRTYPFCKSFDKFHSLFQKGLILPSRQEPKAYELPEDNQEGYDNSFPPDKTGNNPGVPPPEYYNALGWYVWINASPGFRPRPASSYCLGKKLKGSFCTPIIGCIKRKICRNRSYQSNVWKIMSLDDHLGSHKNRQPHGAAKEERISS